LKSPISNIKETADQGKKAKSIKRKAKMNGHPFLFGLSYFFKMLEYFMFPPVCISGDLPSISDATNDDSIHEFPLFALWEAFEESCFVLIINACFCLINLRI
jgi:hypothetical protein